MTAVAYLRLDLVLGAPVVAATAGGDPNTMHTALALPGAMLRGAVAASLLPNISGAASNDPVFRRLILSGDVRWLSAYPVAGGASDGVRALPGPVSLRRLKGADESKAIKLVDVAFRSSGEACDSEDVVLGGGVGFLAPGPAATVVTVAASARIHHQRDREYGRPWTERHSDGTEESHGAVYSYESIDAGQRFAGFVQLRGPVAELETLVREHVRSPLLLGRSRRATYGGVAAVTLATAAQPREHDGEWSLVRALAQDERARLLLTAPAIVRDPVTGQADPGQLAAVVKAALGGRAEVAVFGRRTTVEGYNRHWACPLPQEPAADAGTVLVVTAAEQVGLDDLLALEHRGIGERRIDGFGRVVWLSVPESDLTATPSTATPPPPAVPPEALSPLARRIDTQIRTDRRARRIAAAIGAAEITNPPRASAAARLRGPLRDGRAGLVVLRRWLRGSTGDALRDIAFEQLARCQITLDGHKVPLIDALQALLDDERCESPARDWLAEIVKPDRALAIAPEQTSAIDEDLIAHIIDGLLARVQREASRERAA